MPKEDIIGGLSLAIQKGESLQQAMLTFFNAGYKREEIEEAAKELQTLPNYPIPTQRPQTQPTFSLNPLPKPKKLPQTQVVKPLPLKKLKPFTPTPKEIQPIPGKLLKPVSPTQSFQTPPRPIQKSFQSLKQPLSTSLVSDYGKSKSTPRFIMIITLSILLVILILVLAGVFLFRNTLIGFFSNLF